MSLLLLLSCAEYKAPISMDALFAGATAPNRGHLVLELQDADGFVVTDALAEEFTLEVDGVEVTPDFHRWEDRDVLQKTVVLIDLSDGAGIGPLKVAARTVIEQVDGPIELVGYASGTEVFRSFTDDREALRLALDELEILGPTTDTNQALLDVLDDWEDDLDPASGGVRGAVLLISNGGEGPDAVTVAQVKEAAAGRPIIAVGIGTRLDSVATHGSFRARTEEDLPEALDEALMALSATREGLIWLSWCEAGDQAEVSFKRGRLRGSTLETLGGGTLTASAPWGQATSLPEPIQAHHARVVEGYLYVGGGDWDGNIFYARQLEGGLLGHFRSGPAVPVAGSETRFGSHDGDLVAINGDKAWRLPLQEGVPTEWEDLPSPLYSNAIREAEGELFSLSRKKVYRLDGDSWTESADIPEGGLDGSVGGTIVDGRVVLVGAWREDPTSDWQTRGWSVSVDSLDDWTALPPFPHFMGTFSTTDGDGAEVLVFPGSDADSLEVLRLDGAGWAVAGSLAVARDYFSTAVSPDGLLYLHGGRVDGEKTTTASVSRIQDGALELTCP